MSEKEAKWYVAHTYSGHEKKVKANIEKIVENRGMEDVIHEVVVPTEEKVEIKNGRKHIIYLYMKKFQIYINKKFEKELFSMHIT